MNILSYDIKKDRLKMHMVIHEASILMLSHLINDELIEHYSEYLYYYYNPQADIRTREEVDQIRYLTLHAEAFLNRYKTKIISSRKVLIYSRIAYSYKFFILDYQPCNEYIYIIEESLQGQMNQDSELYMSYLNLGYLYLSTGDYRRSEEYYLKSLQICKAILPKNPSDLVKIYNNLVSLYQSMGDYRRSEKYRISCLKLREKTPTNFFTDYMNL